MNDGKCEVPLELSDHLTCTCVADGNDYNGTVGAGSYQSASAEGRPGIIPLHVACSRTDLHVIQFLLENGAAINAVTFSRSLTPLQVGRSILFSVCVVVCEVVEQR